MYGQWNIHIMWQTWNHLKLFKRYLKMLYGWCMWTSKSNSFNSHRSYTIFFIAHVEHDVTEVSACNKRTL